MDKSTPRPLHKTPWSLAEMIGDARRKVVAAENGLRFGEMNFDSPDDLAFALHAANSHDALVKALRVAADALSRMSDIVAGNPDHDIAAMASAELAERKARAALALATKSAAEPEGDGFTICDECGQHHTGECGE
jgi:hypothetical protein